jgi:hypothetical protein
MEDYINVIVLMSIPIVALAVLCVWQYVHYTNEIQSMEDEFHICEELGRTVSPNDCYFEVEKLNPLGICLVIKKFRHYPDHYVIIRNFSDADWKYSELCAEELCEQLNEPI